MKIALFSIPAVALGKHNTKDSRLDQLDKLVNSKKKTYVQVELLGEDSALEADAILAPRDLRSDLILRDLEFIDTRLERCTQEEEKALLNKLKVALEKEEFISNMGLSPQESQAISGYSLFTNKAVMAAAEEELNDLDALLSRLFKENGFISFFTTGEKETRAWLIRQGTTAWEAAGIIHSDIQKGFIRAEVISFEDFIQAGSENQAKQSGKMRLEQRDYIVQDADVINFRFNK